MLFCRGGIEMKNKSQFSLSKLYRPIIIIVAVAYIIYFMFFKDHTVNSPIGNFVFVIVLVMLGGVYNMPIIWKRRKK